MSAILMAISLLAAKPVALWAGHQVIEGNESFMVLGSFKTHTESFFLAEVVREGDDYVLYQRPCFVDIHEAMGVKVRMDLRAVRAVAPASIRVRHEGNGLFRAQPWEVAWDHTDIDRDGHPGATVHVDSSLCGGDLYVASSTVSSAEGSFAAGKFRGVIAVDISQRILGASGFCLRVASSDSKKQQGGTFAYVPVDDNATCDSLMASGWPVRSGPVQP